MKILAAINYVNYKDPSKKGKQDLCVSLLIQHKVDCVKLVSFNYPDDQVTLPPSFTIIKTLKRNSAKEIGNWKPLPYIKEIFDQCAKEDVKIFGYMNSDVLIENGFYDRLNGCSDVYLFQRIDISEVNKQTLNKHVFNIVNKEHPGFDGIFFDKRWWVNNQHRFNPDMILGEPFWDYYYKELACRYSKKVTIQRALYHIHHETKWNLISPGAENNQKIYDTIK